MGWAWLIAAADNRRTFLEEEFRSFIAQHWILHWPSSNTNSSHSWNMQTSRNNISKTNSNFSCLSVGFSRLESVRSWPYQCGFPKQLDISGRSARVAVVRWHRCERFTVKTRNAVTETPSPSIVERHRAPKFLRMPVLRIQNWRGGLALCLSI